MSRRYKCVDPCPGQPFTAWIKKPRPLWRHSRNDNRGPRKIYLDGVWIQRCVYADTRRGYVLMHTNELNRTRDGMRVKKLHGKVTVFFEGLH